MLFQRHAVCLATTAVCLAAAYPTRAISAEQAQRVEITGSSIKRIAAEGALPVITLNKADIERSGATSVRELVQALPSMQGFTVASDSVNGGGGGTTTASLRNLGSIYTLVLLNGRRVAPLNTGSTVNLEQLPLSAVERVEILADGASALYGADAIAGVVNFITKRGVTDGGVDVSVQVPQHAGGKEMLASVSKGLGDLERDGYNLRAGLSYEKVEAITAAQRPFSKSGVVPFEHKGQALYLWQLSSFANPPNVTVRDAAGRSLGTYAPTLVGQNSCGSDPAAFRQDATCRFDFPATVDAQPESERKNLFVSGQFKLGKDSTAFFEGLLSDVRMTSRFAPPAQRLSMPVGGTLYNRYVLPTLAARGIDPAAVASAQMDFRLRDAGNRTNDFTTQGTHLVAGLDFQAYGFDANLALTHSKNDIRDRYAGGYTSRKEMLRLIEAGQWDPFAQGTGGLSDKLAPAVLQGSDTDTISQLDMVSVKASRPLLQMAGGEAYLGFGLDLSRQRFAEDPSPISMGANPLQPNFDDFPIGASTGALPFDTRRNSAGAFAELVMPLSKRLEITTALRHDSFDAARNLRNFDVAGQPLPAQVQGNADDKATYKIGLRFAATPELLFRASYGTGFRPPTLRNITGPLKEFGVTGDKYACPVTDANDPLRAGCRDLPEQYKVRNGGNPRTGAEGLKPENSKQWNIGLRFEPTAALSIGADVWSIEIKDVITTVPQAEAFANFQRYRSLFAVTTETSTGLPILTFDQLPVNGAVAKSTGVDIDLMGRMATPYGRLTGRLNWTHLIESYFDFGFGGGRETSIGKMGSDDQVAFRNLLRLQTTLEQGAWMHTLTVAWKPGYLDQQHTDINASPIRRRNPDGTPGEFITLDDFRVPAYSLLDWQTRWNFNRDLSLTLGIKNLLDKKPPLSIKTVAGNMSGFDPRYHDGRGRTWSLSAQYRF
jgi:iron complex outermembrane recepter protein